VARGRANYDADPLAPAQVSAALRAGGDRIRFHVQPAPTTYYLALNLRSPRMRRPVLRRAIAMAIDRQALAATHGPDAAVRTDQYLPPTSLGYPGSGHAFPTAAPNIAGARRLLAAAGVSTPITLTLTSCDDATCQADGAPTRARLLRAELHKIGIRLKIEALSRPDQFTLDTSGTGRYDIADEGFVYPNPDPSLIEFPLEQEANMRRTKAMRVADHAPIPRRYTAWRRIELTVARREAPLAAYAVANTLALTDSRLGCIVLQPEYGLDLTRACIGRG
jgi:ABC-type transport system substrate-binding protein